MSDMTALGRGAGFVLTYHKNEDSLVTWTLKHNNSVVANGINRTLNAMHDEVAMVIDILKVP